MAPIQTIPIPFHEGEKRLRSLLHVPDGDNPTSPGLSLYARHLVCTSSLLAIGTLDAEGHPWTTLLGGEPGFARSLGKSLVGIKASVDQRYDPVIELLLGNDHGGEVHEEKGDARFVSALGIHLETRDRVKISGLMVAGALGHHGSTSEAELVFAVQQSLGT